MNGQTRDSVRDTGGRDDDDDGVGDVDVDDEGERVKE